MILLVLPPDAGLTDSMISHDGAGTGTLTVTIIYPFPVPEPPEVRP